MGLFNYFKNENTILLTLIYRKEGTDAMFGAKNIDKDKYISLIAESKEMMYRIAFGYLHDETKALDAVDEAAYLGYVNLGSLREPQYFKTWIVRILINECHKILRKSKREFYVDEIPENSRDFGEDTVHLKLALNNLPAELKKIVILRYFGGYTIGETAKILEIPEGTVSTRTRKALQILRVEYSD